MAEGFISLTNLPLGFRSLAESTIECDLAFVVIDIRPFDAEALHSPKTGPKRRTKSFANTAVLLRCSGSTGRRTSALVSSLPWLPVCQVSSCALRPGPASGRDLPSAAQSPRTRREESAGQRKLTQSWLSASYGKKGQVCELFISPQKPTTPIKSANQTKVIDSKLLTEIINELVPENERGRGISGDFLNIRCLPSDDCVGTGSNWENISIYRNGSSNDEHLCNNPMARCGLCIPNR